MPQAFLPLFSKEMTLINPTIGFIEKDETIYYFLGQLPIFSHHKTDHQAFRLFAAQLYVNGNATQAEIVRAFGIGKNSLKRYVKRYRERGLAGFFEPRQKRRGQVLTPTKLLEIQAQLDAGLDLSHAATAADVKPDTVRKAVSSGRLRKPEEKKN